MNENLSSEDLKKEIEAIDKKIRHLREEITEKQIEIDELRKQKQMFVNKLSIDDRFNQLFK